MQEAIDAEEFGTDALRKTIAVALHYVADPAISAVLLPKLSSNDPSVSFADIIAALPMDDKAAIQDAITDKVSVLCAFLCRGCWCHCRCVGLHECNLNKTIIKI
jgi:hypothetical protein